MFLTNTCSILKFLHDSLYENEYCGKTKKFTPEIFCYVLEKIFIVNLKINILILEIHNLFISRSIKGHKVKYLKMTLS